jgi:outer membrane receptor protein involved in Fe transport
MQAISKELNEITIKGEKAPVEFSGDTIKYNTSAFKTAPNAVVEELLKKLPGVQVEKDGTIKAQGQTVRRVTVDGKEFFGRDPKIATQNLPADAVEQVKLFDKRSDQTEFTGIDDGRREKNIDLKLKDDHKKGVFGTVMGAYGGDNDRFNSRLNLNKFNKTKQFSALGMSNNINKQGFSLMDYLNFTGDMQRMMSGGGGRLSLNLDANDLPMNLAQNPNNGFMRSWAGGLNFNDSKSKKTEINGSYFFNALDNLTEREVNRQNFFINRNFTSNSRSLQNNINLNNRLNFTLDQKIDSLNSFKWTTNASYNDLKGNSNSSGNSINNDGFKENQSNREFTNNGYGYTVNSDFLFRHKFRKKGRTFSSNLVFNASDNDSRGTLMAQNSFFSKKSDGSIDTRIENLNQRNTQNREQVTLGLNGSFTEPLGKRKYLEINYNYRKANSELDRSVYDVREVSESFNSRLSNRFENEYTYNRGGLNFRMNQKKYNFSTGLSFQQAELDGNLLIQNVNINRKFRNLLPNAHFNYNFTTTNTLRIDYETNFREPNLQDLSPIIDNSDPLNIREGNPNLKPEYVHQFNTNLMLNNPSNFSFFMTFLSMNYTQNRISSSQTVNSSLIRTIKPINVRYGLNLMGDAQYGFRIKPIKANANIGYRVINDRSLSMVNDVENETNQIIHRGDVKLNFRISDNLNFGLNSELSYNDTRYSVNKSFNQAFLTGIYGYDLTWNLPKKWNFMSDFEYMKYSGRSDGFNQGVPIWNLAISKFFLKNKRGELKASVNDVLNRNVGINRTAQANFIQDERILSLGRYYLLTFTYNLKSFGNEGGMKIIAR